MRAQKIFYVHCNFYYIINRWYMSHCPLNCWCILSPINSFCYYHTQERCHRPKLWTMEDLFSEGKLLPSNNTWCAPVKPCLETSYEVCVPFFLAIGIVPCPNLNSSSLNCCEHIEIRAHSSIPIFTQSVVPCRN